MSKVLTPVLLLLVSVGLYFSYISPAFDTLKAYEVQEVRIDKALDDSKKLREKREELLARYNNIPNEEMERLEKLLPDSIDTVRTIVDLDTLASLHELTVSSFGLPQTQRQTRVAAREGAAVDPVGRSLLTITCSGKYDAFKAFLYDIESSLALMDVVSLSVKPQNKPQGARTEEEENDDENTDKELEYSISLQLYWLQ